MKKAFRLFLFMIVLIISSPCFAGGSRVTYIYEGIEEVGHLTTIEYSNGRTYTYGNVSGKDVNVWRMDNFYSVGTIGEKEYESVSHGRVNDVNYDKSIDEVEE